MTDVRAKLSAIGIRRIVHAVVVLAFLAMFLGIMEGWKMLAWVVAIWTENGIGLVDDFQEFVPHRIHELVFALVFWTVVIGMLAQLRSPRKHVAGQWMALLPFVALGLAIALTGFTRILPIIAMFGSFTLVATLLHPTGRELVTSVSAERASRVMLVLVLVAAAPLVAFAATEVGLQTGAIEQGGHDHDHAGGATDAEVHESHVEHGHFAMSAAFGFLVVGLGFLSSLRQAGWWLPAWFTGILVSIYGVASVTFPELASSGGTTWGLAAIAWAVAFVAAAELTQDAETPSLLGELRDRPATGA